MIFSGAMGIKTLSMYFLGAFIRFYLINSKYRKPIADRVEISTPINSWKRVTEGLLLEEHGIDPFVGDFLHEQPLNMYVYGCIVKLFGQYLYLAFIACDILTVLVLNMVVARYMQHLKEESRTRTFKGYAEIAVDIDFINPANYVTVAYLFNPYTIFNCVAFTTTCLVNFFLALFLFGLVYGNIVVSAFAVAVCANHSLYPILLVSPLFLSWIKCGNRKKAVLSVVAVFGFVGLLTGASFFLQQYSWGFLKDTYGFILSVPDLRPNIGLFWYFFIEMFEHFRSLFIYSFQINVTLLYFIPLSIRFRQDPALLAANLLCLIATFKSYPCLGDIGFVLALLPCWKHLFNYVQQGFLVAGCFIVTTALAPTVWHLWIYSGSANANFYFGATLAFATAQIFLITDVLFAYVKREFTMKHGKMRTINGKDYQLILE